MDSASEAARILDLTARRDATLGGGRLICIDGPAGAGKTTLARAIGDLDPTATVLGTDAMLEGWRGLPGLSDTVGALLGALAQGLVGTWPRWSWVRDTYIGSVDLAPGPLLVLEGVGCWARAHRHLVTTLVWVEAPTEVRLRRWLERDGEEQRRYWADWLADEAAVHEREGTRAAADLVLSTVGTDSD